MFEVIGQRKDQKIFFAVLCVLSGSFFNILLKHFQHNIQLMIL